MFNLRRSSNALEADAAKRRQALQRKRAAAARVKARVETNSALISESIEAAQQKRREAAAAAASAAAAAALVVPPVVFRAVYRVVTRAECGMVGDGFDENGDRVLLPLSALKTLEGERALRSPRSGGGGAPMAFELTTREGGRTHAGVLEFSAPEGTICLPRKVADCLGAVVNAGSGSGGGDGGSEDERSTFVQRVTVKYASLPKGTSVTLQPRGSSFVEDVASDWRCVKGVLENAMRSHTTLTTGDWLTIEHAGRGYDGKFVNVAVEKWSAVKSVDTLRTH